MVAVLGFSGSPVKNSNTDRLVKAVLGATGQKSEFIKLSDLNIRPCMGCKKCVPDNICRVGDDFPAVAEKIKAAKAMVIGAYTPYGQIDGFTKALLERFWSLRHVNNLLKGKLCVTILTSLVTGMVSGVNQAMAAEISQYEGMELLGQLSVSGNLPCLTCGRGDDCRMSGIAMIYGPDSRTADHEYARVEDQGVWDEAVSLGRVMGNSLNA